MIEIRDATAADWEEFFGSRPRQTFRAVVGEEDGELLGIGGVVYERVPKVFMDLTEAGAKRPKDIVKGTKKVIDALKKNHAMVYAVAQNDDVARRFLAHFGFRYVADTDTGALYQWRKWQ